MGPTALCFYTVTEGSAFEGTSRESMLSSSPNPTSHWWIFFFSSIGAAFRYIRVPVCYLQEELVEDLLPDPALQIPHEQSLLRHLGPPRPRHRARGSPAGVRGERPSCGEAALWDTALRDTGPAPGNAGTREGGCRVCS